MTQISQHTDLNKQLILAVLDHQPLADIERLVRLGAQDSDIFLAACENRTPEEQFVLYETVLLAGHPVSPGWPIEPIIQCIAESTPPLHARANVMIKALISGRAFDTPKPFRDLSHPKGRSPDVHANFMSAMDGAVRSGNLHGIKFLARYFDEDPKQLYLQCNRQALTLSMPMLAAKFGHIACLDYLLSIMQEEAWPVASTMRKPLVVVAAAAGQREVIEHLAERGFSMNASNEEKNDSALQQAIYFEHYDLAKRLVELGGYINGPLRGNSPLVISICKKHKPTFDLLIERGADIHHKTNLGWDALMYAVQRDTEWAINRLLARGANPHTVDREGNTLLHIGTTEPNISIDRALDMGIGINTQNQAGNTPLIFAAKRDSAEYVLHLIERGADLDIVNLQGQTAMDVATPPLKALIQSARMKKDTQLARSDNRVRRM